MPTSSPEIGDVIHVSQMAIEEARVCSAAIVGGYVSDELWVLVIQFNGSRISWLRDENWHYKNACTTNPRTGEVRHEQLTEGI